MKHFIQICAMLLLSLGPAAFSLRGQDVPAPPDSVELSGVWTYLGICAEGHRKNEKICKICSDALSSSGFPEQETRLTLHSDGGFSFASGEKSMGGTWERSETGLICLHFRDAFSFSMTGNMARTDDELRLLFPYSKFEGFLQRTQSIVGKADTFLTIVALQTTVSDGGKVSVGFRLKRVR